MRTRGAEAHGRALTLPDARARSGARILVLSGPNLERLGTREPADLRHGDARRHPPAARGARPSELGVEVDCAAVEPRGRPLSTGSARAATTASPASLLNAGAYTHTSLALLDAHQGASRCPCVEVHLSNPEAREPFRHASRIAPACVGKVAGFGADSTCSALERLDRLRRRSRVRTP